jgi:hypothetical protein
MPKAKTVKIEPAVIVTSKRGRPVSLTDAERKASQARAIAKSNAAKKQYLAARSVVIRKDSELEKAINERLERARLAGVEDEASFSRLAQKALSKMLKVKIPEFQRGRPLNQELEY